MFCGLNAQRPGRCGQDVLVELLGAGLIALDQAAKLFQVDFVPLF